MRAVHSPAEYKRIVDLARMNSIARTISGDSSTMLEKKILESAPSLVHILQY